MTIGACVVPVILSIIFGGIFCLIYFFGNKDKYDAQVMKLDAFTGHQTGWLFFSAWLYCRTVHWLNVYPMGYKTKWVPGNGGNMRANPFVYKIVGQGDLKNTVVMQDEGAIGQYNRANRSLAHFLENSTPILLCIVLTPLVFGYIAFIFAAIFCFGRIAHMVGYSSEKGYGAHGIGFLFFMIGQESLIAAIGLIAILGAWVEPTALAL